MAEKKNFTIENYNGADYDTLYPQTNSGQVLLDNQAQGTLGLTFGSTVNDGFDTIAQGNVIYKIGDTLTTARTDLGNKWLLCNGAQISPDQYPGLSSLFTAQTYLFEQTSGVSAVPMQGTTNPKLAYNPATNQLAFSCYSYSTSGNQCYLYYLDLNSTSPVWTRVSTISYVNGNTGIICVNNTWIINNQYYIGALSADTAFSNISNLSYSVFDVVYHNNYYYISTGSNVYVYNNLSLSPLKTIANTSTGTGPLGVTPNGVVVTYLSLRTTSNITYNYTLISDTLTTTTGSWKVTQTLNTTTCSWCAYYNGYYYWYVEGSASQCYLYRSNSLSSTPTLFQQLSTSALYTLANNNLILSCGNYIDTSNTLQSFSQSPSGSYKTNVVVTPTDMYQIAGSQQNMLLYSASTTGVIKLPTVSLSTGLYTYIRAKS